MITRIVSPNKRSSDAHKIYLDALRESGQTNMYGAAPYLAHHFGITKYEARAILKDWMDSHQ
jgi:hypothetical protein